MAALVRGFNALQQELEKTKESLKDVDETIKKLTGRDPTELGRSGQQRRILLGFNERGGVNAGGEPLVNRGNNRKRVQVAGKWSGNDADQGPTRKKRGNIASRLGPRPSRSSQDSGDGDELVRKPSVPSSVVATSRDSLTRKDMLDAQGKDERGMARNKRMFGLLLGTLQKFKDEARHKQDKNDQRQQVELKLEEKAQQERDEIRKEREMLFQNRREKQARIRLLEQKMELMATHEKCEAEIRKLTNFICTKTKPCVFYLPKVHTPATESRLAETGKVVEEMISERRRRLATEINELMGPSSLASTMEAGEDQEMDEEDDDGENIPTSRRDREDAQSTGNNNSNNNKRYHRSGGLSGKDWSKNHNKDGRKTAKRSTSTGGSSGDPYHPLHQDNKSGSKHGRGWDSRQLETQRSVKSSKDSFGTGRASSAISTKALSNKWQLLMEMDSGLEEDEEKTVMPSTVLKPGLPSSTDSPTTQPVTSLALLQCQRNDDDDDDHHEDEVMMEADKREVRLEENSSINGTEDRRLVEATSTTSSAGGGVGNRRVVLSADVEEDDDDEEDDDEDDDDDENDVPMKPTTEK